MGPLLQSMEDGLIISVLGRDLLRVEVDGRSVDRVTEGLEAALGSRARHVGLAR